MIAPSYRLIYLITFSYPTLIPERLFNFHFCLSQQFPIEYGDVVDQAESAKLWSVR